MRPAIVDTSDVELKVTSERDCMNQHSCSKKRKERQEKNRLVLILQGVRPYPCSLPNLQGSSTSIIRDVPVPGG